MSASISLKQNNVGSNFLKRTAGLISGAAGDYFHEALPVTSSIAKDVKDSAASLGSVFNNTTRSVMPKIRQIKAQANVRNIMRWYMNSESEFGGVNDLDSGLDFDIDIDDNGASIAEAQMNESTKNAKEISLSVVESSHRMVEAQISNTANILSSIDNQTSVITSGFNRVNDTLNKILEVVTKNTATMIETTVAAANAQKDDHAGNIINGKFNLGDYKKLIGNNMKNNPELGMAMAFLPMLTSPGSAKMFLTPENITSMIFSGVLNKKSPNLKKNLQALDDVINETIVDSLIRLGTNKSYSTKGSLARLLGIDPSRKATDTSRSTLELKTVPFDSIAHESITNAIPGYLRKILVQLGGEDLIYDYRSRSFKSKGKIRKEFHQAGATTGSLNRASAKMQNAIGKDGFGNMVYDMMMSDIGANRMDESGRRLIETFSDPKKFEEYITGTVLKGMKINQNELKRITQMGQKFSSAARSDENFGRELSNQAARNNLNRNKRMKQYVDNANAYHVDLSEFSDTFKTEMKTIAAVYGKSMGNESTATVRGSKVTLEGVNYTNAALFEIFTRLDRGINVFQVGSNNERSTPFKSLSGRLPKPKIHRPKNVSDSDVKPGAGFTSALSGTDTSDDPNLLQNQTKEDGSVEDLSKGERFKRWGKKRGGNFGRALFSGSPEQVREAFGLIIRDVTQVAGDQVKKGAASINNQFGNVSGYLKHKLFGTEYIFQDGVDKDGNPIIKKVAKNEKGGIFGFVGDYVKDMFKGTKEKGQKWFNTVKGYFDYGDNGGSKEDKSVVQKRNKFLSVSAGAFAGAGLLGGPIGLIMGAVAGNALSGLDIGSKIKGMLFGRDEKGKAKGLFTRLADGVVDPIKYQIGKTTHHLGGVLKKNIIGPLADIGGAIRDRITSSAESHFGKVFKAIGKIILAPFKGIGKSILSLAKLPITLVGGTARAGMSVAGGLTGGILNSIAGSIAGKSTHVEIDPETGERIEMSTKDWLKQRRKERKNDVKSDKYDDYKTWKQKENARRSERLKKFKGYTEEEVSIVTAESTEKMAEETSEISKGVSQITGEIIPGSSFKTHDQGIHDRLDTIINFFKGGMKREDPNIIDVDFKEVPSLPDKGAQLALPGPTADDGDNEVANNAMMAASVLAATGDEVTGEESRLAGGIIDEAGKKKSNRGKIIPKLKELMGLQGEKKKENGEKKESFFSKIFDAVKSGFGGVVSKLGLLGTAVGGLLAFDELKSLWDNVFTGDKSLADWWGEDSKIGKAVQGIMDVSKFVGTYGGSVVNMVSSGIGKLTKWLPFMPEINPPQINTSGPFAGIQAAILGGLYAKGASAIGSVVSAVANVISSGSNALSNLTGGKSGKLGKFVKGASIAMAGYSYLKGPEVHENTDAAGNEIVDEDRTRGMRSYGTKLVAQKGFQALGNRGARIAGERATAGIMNNLADAGIKAGIDKNGKAFFKKAGKFVSNEAVEAATGTAKNEVAEAVVKSLGSNADDVAKSKGAMGFVKKALTGIKNFLMKNKTFSKFAKVIGTKIDDLLVNIAKGADSIIAKIPQKIANIITKGGTKEAASVATAGIGYAVMAFGGALSGGLSAANIFGVREKDVNGTMRTVASVVVAMINGVPGLWALELIDLFIAPITFRGFICQLLYGLLGGGDDLAEKQGVFAEDLSAYNEQYGAELSTDEYNDMVNKSMFAKIFGKGSVKTDENGRAMFDDAGAALRTNHGIAGWFSGGEKEYVKDKEGNVIKINGKAIQARDEHGHKLTKDASWTDKAGNWFRDVGSFFAGQKTYETDENGRAIVDENGEFIVKSKEGNIFQRAGAGISNWWNGQEITNPDGTTTKTTGFKDAATKTLGNIGSTIAKPFKDVGAAISDWWAGDVETDADGNPLTDEDGKPIRKGGIKDKIFSTAGKINDTIYHVSKHVGGKLKDFALGEYELDENGNPLLDENNKPIRKGGIAGAVKSGIGLLNKHVLTPVKDAAKGAADWIGDKAKWLGDKAKDAGSWIADKASSMWKSVSTPVKDAAKSAGNWIKNKASWLGDKAKDAGAWISEKAGNIWDTISTPVKNAASGVADWVKKKAGWVKDKAKDVGSWISDKAGTIFDSITDNVKDLAKGASDFVKDKVDWVKDGAKSAADWIGDKAKGIWDWVTGGIKDMAESGKEYERKEQYIKDAQGKGGPYRVGAPEAATLTGGNPLSKDFAVTSGFGKRADMGDFHKGVDLIPKDKSMSANVMSRFNGKIISVTDNVSNSDTGSPYRGNNSGGNEVIIQADDGTIIKNNHLKAGSIPGNIKVGSRVDSGQKIGEMGSTGRSTGPHLHYQVEVPNKKGGMTPINPLSKGSSIPSNGKYRKGDPLDLVSSAASVACGLEKDIATKTSANAEFAKWINTIKQVKAQFAAKNMGYSQSRYTNITVNGKTVNMRTDCSGFVSACVSCFCPEVSMMEGTGTMESPSHSKFKQAGFIRYNWPGWEGLYQGDIMVRSGHTEIFCNNEGSSHKVWNCGSDSSCNSATPTSSSKPSYTTVWRHKSSTGASIDPGAAAVTDGSGSFGDTSGSSTESSSGGGILGVLSNLGNAFLYAISGGLIGSNGSTASASGDTSGYSGISGSGSFTPIDGEVGEGASEIWKFLKKAGFSDEGAAGIMGNLEAESGMKSNNLQNSYEKKFGMNDAQYTAAVDNGSYKNFVHDSGGYGLAQWTYHSRKQKLYDAAKAAGKSVSDTGVQMNLLLQELADYGLLDTIKGSNDLKAASNLMLHKFEAPADQSAAVENKRASMGQKYYNQFKGQGGLGGPIDEFDQSVINIPGMPSNSRDYRVGGPENEISNNSRFVQKTGTTTKSQILSSAKSKIQSMVKPVSRSISTLQNPLSNNTAGTSQTSGTDLTSVMNALSMILDNLKQIASNTGSSSELLGSLNEKDFVDQGVRDSLNALKGKRHQSKRTSSPASARSVAAIARP
ncbi:MAG: phage tail tip lysozyme [Roseburia sp.]|nr:phage tail tip lysozyme [Roseburia sp.]